ncbi:hypothetical protein EXIGLDRAFT_721450 [Exidia glandulosa HHB12029]|uniref:Uncharacterized protein n=1 Tax=Exidia glandulosa HHB12029 TaxID=1314781 RepID=A0A165FRV2_EXIGL|nr:hypothetical protein EXIGLDRAFT_721450 [Exidia glandulosa HHB12029]
MGRGRLQRLVRKLLPASAASRVSQQTVPQARIVRLLRKIIADASFASNLVHLAFAWPRFIPVAAKVIETALPKVHSLKYLAMEFPASVLDTTKPLLRLDFATNPYLRQLHVRFPHGPIHMELTRMEFQWTHLTLRCGITSWGISSSWSRTASGIRFPALTHLRLRADTAMINLQGLGELPSLVSLEILDTTTPDYYETQLFEDHFAFLLSFLRPARDLREVRVPLGTTERYFALGLEPGVGHPWYSVTGLSVAQCMCFPSHTDMDLVLLALLGWRFPHIPRLDIVCVCKGDRSHAPSIGRFREEAMDAIHRTWPTLTLVNVYGVAFDIT